MQPLRFPGGQVVIRRVGVDRRKLSSRRVFQLGAWNDRRDLIRNTVNDNYHITRHPNIHRNDFTWQYGTVHCIIHTKTHGAYYAGLSAFRKAKQRNRIENDLSLVFTAVLHNTTSWCPARRIRYCNTNTSGLRLVSGETAR